MLMTDSGNAAPKDMTERLRAKIRPLSELADIAADLKRKGEVVVLAHGTFDLLHVGHVHHLLAARREGTVLVVTLTADEYVIKGPGRPVFSEQYRSEMLASLECVDWVAIHSGASAEEVIHAIKPVVYIKGAEYADAEKDLTGKIVSEREAVELNGGRLAFTNEVTFSSSSLINRHLNVFDASLQQYLDNLRARNVGDDILAAVESVYGLRVLVIGDAIVDEYQYTAPLGKSAKENIIATLYQDNEIFAGGVMATANHMAEFCGRVDVVTVLGGHDSHEELIRASLKPNINFIPFIRKGAPTTRKTRFVEAGYFRKMFEVYHMDDQPISGALEDEIDTLICEKARDYDLIVVNDFGHGLLTPRIIASLENHARFLTVNAQTNSANIGYNLVTKYTRADYIAIDAPEARLAAREKFGNLEADVVAKLKKMVHCERMVVTHGGKGCYVCDENDNIHQIPAFTKQVIDTVGAGDAFFGITSLLAARSVPSEFLGVVGNAAGAMKVRIVGHRKSVEKVPLMKFLVTLLK